jgi:phospholipase C
MRQRTGLWLLATSFLVGCGASHSAELSSSVTENASVGPGTGTPADGGLSLSGAGDNKTTSPIKHVIVIIGENRTFDHIFATYQPKSGQSVDNLLSKGIINADGSPGPNFAQSVQYSAIDSNPAQDVLPENSPQPSTYQNAPGDKTAYAKLPPPGVGGPVTPYISSLAEAQEVENGLAADYYQFLTTGGTGIAAPAIDTRILEAENLPPGPFQLTPGVGYDDYAASPVHRFYQMWQQLDCNVDYATTQNPSGCLSDLFSWVETSVGAGANGAAQPETFTELTTHEGSTALGFYNVQQGDAPYLKSIADTYAMSDNYHQAVMGGTGANHIMLGTGDAIYYSDGLGNATVPPSNEIENPNPQPGTNNWYTEDGYGTFGTAADGGTVPVGGGSFTECADSTQPGATPILSYLQALPYEVKSRCEEGHYYLLNNYNPGYFGDGTPVNLSDPTQAFTVPPSSVPTIGDQLLTEKVSFAYFGDQFDLYLTDPNQVNPADNYCNICNFFQYNTSIMTNSAIRQAHLKDTADLYSAISQGELPAVSFVKPSGFVDGHPASSKLDLFEGFVKKIADLVQSQPSLWKDTAILVTFDEGGGYYDSGYVQPVDYFGDGTRIPLLVISSQATGGRVSHEYTDHVSILKFIERNWNLHAISSRSRDNLPNPTQNGANPYVPTNAPAIGDLFDLFNFAHQ